MEYIPEGVSFRYFVVQCVKYMKKLQLGIRSLVIIGCLLLLGILSVQAGDFGEKKALKRDEKRLSQLGSLAERVVAYQKKTGDYPEANDKWMEVMIDASVLDRLPPTIEGTACNTNAVHNYCYARKQKQLIIYTKLESRLQNARCSGNTAWGVYSLTNGRGGIICLATEPSEMILDDYPVAPVNHYPTDYTNSFLP